MNPLWPLAETRVAGASARCPGVRRRLSGLPRAAPAWGKFPARLEPALATATEKAEPLTCSGEETISQRKPLFSSEFRSRPAADLTGSLEAIGSLPSTMTEIRRLGAARARGARRKAAIAPVSLRKARRCIREKQSVAMRWIYTIDGRERCSQSIARFHIA